MAAHNDLGMLGEEKSVEYLQSQGYVIKQRNWRFGRYEIDIVAETADYLVIVEVKARKDGAFSSPTDRIDKVKIRNLVYAANAYIRRFNVTKPTRFDVISMTLDSSGNTVSFQHLEDAFLPFVNM
ncbi:MAG: YraN family protein [Paludibacteraceae bacterium]|nr:YraN family protein [Paludibacteraceae bacterium]MBR2260183.1 YraN family protein [Paludibacteraceae bacterium]MEE3483889.1 YraN family protein [Bacteroidales bacterium]